MVLKPGRPACVIDWCTCSRLRLVTLMGPVTGQIVPPHCLRQVADQALSEFPSNSLFLASYLDLKLLTGAFFGSRRRLAAALQRYALPAVPRLRSGESCC